MDKKFIFGIIVPAAIVLLLVILSAFPIGMNASETLVSQISYGSFANSSDVSVKQVEIENAFFMPRKFSFPRLAACLNDIQNENPRQSVSVRFAEVKQPRNGEVFPSLDAVFYDSSSIQSPAVDLAPFSKKTVGIYVSSNFYPKGPETYPVTPDQVNATKSRDDYYSKYDELILFELKPDENEYSACTDSPSSRFDGAVRIKIVK